MRLARFKIRGRGAVYHCISRVVGGELLLDDSCKEMLVRMLWKLAGFCGVEVITYCMMSNHFHVLVRVAPVTELADNELVERLNGLYGRKGSLTVLAREGLEQRGRIDAEVKGRILARMGDVSEFMKELKQRFSRWYNRRNNRFGTLWAERFKSVLVEDQPKVVEAVALYIDLNPVRAGLVADPKDYRFCGYAAAIAGNTLARKGLLSIPLLREPTVFTQNTASDLQSDSVSQSSKPLKSTTLTLVKLVPNTLNIKEMHSDSQPARLTDKPVLTWPDCAAAYRMRLFSRAGNVHQSGKAVLSQDKIRQILKHGGKLSSAEVFRIKVRHMSDGVALGTKEFVENVFAQFRDRFSSQRKDGARPIRFLGDSCLHTLRDLQVRVLG